MLSIVSSAGRTGSWSMLSGLSLSEVSQIALLAIPIYAGDLKNVGVYDFEPADYYTPNPPFSAFDQDPAGSQSVPQSASQQEKALPTRWLKKLLSGFPHPSQRQKPVRMSGGGEEGIIIFGVPLNQSIQVSNNEISGVRAGTDPAAPYGRIPTVIARSGAYIKMHYNGKVTIYLVLVVIRVKGCHFY